VASRHFTCRSIFETEAIPENKFDPKNERDYKKRQNE